MIEPSQAWATSCTCLRLRKAARQVSQIYDQHLEPVGLTITQFGLLAHIKSHDGISIGALAGMLIMDPTTLTRNLRPIERRGLVVLEPDPRDRRARRLRLTGRGLQAYRDGKPAWAKAQRQVEQAFGAADTAALRASLDSMMARLAP